MSGFSVTEPSKRQKWIAGLLVITYVVVTLMPILWIIAIGFKSPEDAISYPPKVLFQPNLVGYVNLFTTRTRITVGMQEGLQPPANWYEQIMRDIGTVIVGPSRYGQRFLNSVTIGFGSTFLVIFFGTLAAYAFSRFKVPLRDDLLLFILSTRMMPPIAVMIPMFLLFRQLGLNDTHLGMIQLYTAVNLLIAGLKLPPSGEIFIDGEEVSQKPTSQRDIAFVFQMFALYPHLNVRQNISYPLKSQGMPGAQIKAKVAEVARVLGIEDILNKPIGGLSGGDRQRAALGRAIVREPKAFLMDEPRIG